MLAFRAPAQWSRFTTTQASLRCMLRQEAGVPSSIQPNADRRFLPRMTRGSVHTFVCPNTNTEDTVLLVRVEGANINFTESGQFHSILDATLIQHLPWSFTSPGSGFFRLHRRRCCPHRDQAN